MKRAGHLFGLAILACGMWTTMTRADVLAEYTYEAGDGFSPQTQGWTLGAGTEEDVNFFSSGGVSLLIQESTGPPNVLFTHTVPTSAFSGAWSFTGTNRFAGNSQEEFGMFMFADDGTNLWHMSFYNHGNDDTDGIYMGGDPAGPVLGVTATKVWAEMVGSGPGGTLVNKPFDGFHDWALVDTDGAGGAPPKVQLDGEDLAPLVSAVPAPSMFPAGTVGWGSLNDNEAGFFQTTSMIFEATAGTTPTPLPGDYNNNRVVDAADYVQWRDNLGDTDETALNGNGNGMNGVDQGDYTLWRTNFGTSAPGLAAAVVPEPSGQLLLTICGLLVAALKRRTTART